MNDYTLIILLALLGIYVYFLLNSIRVSNLEKSKKIIIDDLNRMNERIIELERDNKYLIGVINKEY